MFVSFKWLSEYVDIEHPPADLAAKLTQAGVEVVGIKRLHTWGAKVVVGQVLAVRGHPNADRLILVTVDCGEAVVEVVCGAPNVRVGQKVVFAKLGAELVDPHQEGATSVLKPIKLRGFLSQGMVCSEKELDIGDDHDRIVELEPQSEIGTQLEELYGDSVLELEPTPNRPDCFGVLGIAREVAVLTGANLRLPETSCKLAEAGLDAPIKIKIQDPRLCARYTATVIKGVRIGPSPAWLRQRLESVGERSINNVVDVTNFVMLEYGQPLHAFDLSKIDSSAIVVRNAKKGERLVTLDGVERRLSASTLVVADAQKAVALAGIMGGYSSEVASSSTDILLEVANFNGPCVRRTARELDLRTEASVRFEKGLNPELVVPAAQRAAGLILKVCGSPSATSFTDGYPKKQAAHRIFLPAKAVGGLLGTKVAPQSIVSTLTSLGFGVSKSAGGWDVTVPFWRTDTTLAVDLCEEVARIQGYDGIPAIPLSGALPVHLSDTFRDFRDRVQNACANAGLRETISYSALPSDAETGILASGAPSPVKLKNPVSADFAVMRRSLRVVLLNNLTRNLRSAHSPIALFECGKVYGVKNSAPIENWQAAGLLSGLREPLTWHASATHPDFYDAKGAAEDILGYLGVAEADYSILEDPFFEPGRGAAIAVNGIVVGAVGQIRRTVLERFGAKGLPAVFFELWLEQLFAQLEPTAFKTPPRLPDAFRDFSLVLDCGTPAKAVKQLIGRHKLVVAVQIFDVFRGAGIPHGKQGLAVRVTLRSLKRTLDADAIQAAEKQILHQLKDQLGAVLRV